MFDGIRYAIISGNDNDKDQDNTGKMLAWLLDNNYRVLPAYGSYYGQVEICLVVYNISRSGAKRLAKLYNQDSFIYCSAGIARLVNTKTGQVKESTRQDISHTAPQDRDYIYVPTVGYLHWRF
jgi:hypothetical protein